MLNRFETLILGNWDWRERLAKVREQVGGFLGGNDWVVSPQAR